MPFMKLSPMIQKITGIYIKKVPQTVIDRTKAHITNDALKLITNITENVRDKIAEALKEGEENGRAIAATASKLLKTGLDKGVFKSARKRAYLIARTELHRARQEAAIDIYKAADIEMVKWVGIPDDGRICEKCANLHGKNFHIDNVEHYPPLHPRCRCRLLPADYQLDIEVKKNKKNKVMKFKLLPNPKDYKYIIKLGKLKKSEDWIEKSLEKSTRPHKYIKRLGAPSNYRYFYKEPEVKPEEKIQRNLLDTGNPEVLKALQIASDIHAEGGHALFVGGSVRDALLGRKSKDIDIEVYGFSPDKLSAMLSRYGKVDQVGKSFGVFKVSTDAGAIDVSIPRRENKVGKGHKGFMVEHDPSMSYKDAAGRRDLTINSLGYDPVEKTIVDEYGGLQDLKDGKLRATNPETFVEDSLRVLRVMRFAAQLGFTPDLNLVRLCRSIDLTDLPKERIFGELEGMLLKSRAPSIGLKLIPLLGIDKVLPELTKIRGVEQEPDWHPEGDAWNHTLMVVDQAAKIRGSLQDPKERLIFMLGALLHDVGKPETTKVREGRITSYGHDNASAKIALEFLNRLTDDQYIKDKVESIVREHMKPTFFFHDKVPASAIRRLAKKVNIPMLIMLSVADKMGRGVEKVDLKAERWLSIKYKELGLQNPEALQPRVRGRDLIALGVQPGKDMGRILDRIYNAQLDGKFQTAQEGIEYAKEQGLIEKSNLEKSQVKGHYRTIKGKRVWVGPYSTSKEKHEPIKEDTSGIKTVGLGISAQFAKDKYIDLRGQKATSAQDVAELAQIYRNPKWETFRYIYVKNGVVVGHEGRSCHIPGLTLSFKPEQRYKEFFEMKRRIARLGADEVWVLHNHPSGNPLPSQDDLSNERWLSKLIPEIKGSLIINSGKYSVIDSETGIFTTHDIKTDEKIHQHLIENPLLGTVVKTKDDVSKIAVELKAPTGFTTVLYRTPAGGIRAIQEVPTKMLNHYEAFLNYIRGRMREFGSQQVLIADSPNSKLEPEGYQNILRMVRDGQVLDEVKYEDTTGKALESAREGLGHHPYPEKGWMGRPFKTYVTKSLEKGDYSSTQVDLSSTLANKVLSTVKLIDEKDLHPDENEDKPHITIRYGFTEGVLPEDVEKIVAGTGRVEASILGVDIFQPEGKDYDVLILRIDSPEIDLMNEKLKRLPHGDTYPFYQPHITIAYLKRGSGKKYKDLVTGLEGETLKFDVLKFSNKNRNKTNIDLEKARSHKYIKREGAPKHYIYTYKEGKTFKMEGLTAETMPMMGREIIKRIDELPIVEQIKLDIRLHDHYIATTPNIKKRYAIQLQQNSLEKQKVLDIFEGRNTNPEDIKYSIDMLLHGQELHRHWATKGGRWGGKAWNNKWVEIYDKWISKLKDGKTFKMEGEKPALTFDEAMKIIEEGDKEKNPQVYGFKRKYNIKDFTSKTDPNKAVKIIDDDIAIWNDKFHFDGRGKLKIEVKSFSKDQKVRGRYYKVRSRDPIEPTEHIIEIDRKYSEAIPHEYAHFIFNDNGWWEHQSRSLTFEVNKEEIEKGFDRFTESFANYIEKNSQDKGIGYPLTEGKAALELFKSLKSFYSSDDFLNEFKKGIATIKPAFKDYGKFLSWKSKIESYTFEPTEIFARACETYCTNKTPESVKMYFNDELVSDPESFPAYNKITQEWGDKYLKTGIVKSMTLEKSMEKVRLYIDPAKMKALARKLRKSREKIIPYKNTWAKRTEHGLILKKAVEKGDEILIKGGETAFVTAIGKDGCTCRDEYGTKYQILNKDVRILAGKN